ncbi:MAG: hypothetical protein WC683_04595 [bacterium]
MPTYSYSGDPSLSDVDAVRFLIDDTDPADWLFSDEEIGYLLATYGTVNLAAAEALYIIIRAIARNPNFRIGRWSEDRSTGLKILEEKADKLKAQGQTAGIYAGGIGVADKQAKEEDTDRVPPSFRKGMHDDPDTVNADIVHSGEENWGT